MEGKSLIAYCGLDCSNCPAYIATQNNDMAMREQVAQKWSTEFGHTNPPLDAQDINCEGCTCFGAHFQHCFSCQIRTCAQDNEVENCGMCTHYAVCEKIHTFHEKVPEAKASCDAIFEDVSR